MSDEIERQDALTKALTRLTEAQELAASTEVDLAKHSLDDIQDQAPDMKIELMRRSQEVERRTALVRAAMKDVENAMAAKIDEARRMIEPLQRQVKLAQEGIWTLNLYLGRDEQIETLREGEPASITEPISLRQMVLSMDEESMARYDVGGIDFRDINVFCDWLLESPDHLDQVIPETKGVIVLVPRRQGAHYSDDPWLDQEFNKHNHRSHWLIRNGDRLWLMTTDINVGKRLVPAADEFTRFFEKDSFGREISPGSREWMRAEEAADAQKRHYMRIAMVLQGLIDRTTVFHPLPPGVSVLSIDSYDEGIVRVVTDDERAIGDGLEPFDQWHARVTKQMHPGMRVVFARNRAFREVREERMSVPGASQPEPGIYTLEKGRGDMPFRFRYERTDKRWGLELGDYGRWGEWEYSRKGVSIYVCGGDLFVIPLEVVTETEIERYINSRLNRHRYLDMLPLLRAALDAKRQEAAEEDPFRQMLIGYLMTDTGDPRERIEEVLPELIRDYKVGNKWHRPLIGMTDAEQSKAIKLIANAYRRSNDDGRVEIPIKKILERAPGTVGVWRYANGELLSIEPQPLDDRLSSRSEGVFWLHRVWDETGEKLIRVTEWKPMSTIRLRQVYTTEAWTNRNLNIDPSAYITGPELDVVIAEILERIPDAMAISWHEYEQRSMVRFRVWRMADAPSWPEHILTNDRPDFFVMRSSAYWTRKQGVRFEMRYLRSDEISGSHHSIRGDDGDYPWVSVRYWEGHKDFRRIDNSVWLNDQAVAELDRELIEYRHKVSVEKNLRRQLSAALDTVERLWIEREEQQRYDEFLAEYKDPSLWEGHAKTLPQIRFPYRGHDGGPLRDVLAVLIERGIPVDGRAIEELFTVARTFLDESDGPVSIPDDLRGIYIESDGGDDGEG